MNNSLSTIAKQDATFTLVKSMSRSEKRTFKIMASTYKNATPDYVRLFDYMASQETYSDDVVKEHFKDEPFIAFFSARKKYLYYKIMESLRRHYDEKANKLGFYTTLRNVQILNDKGLTNLYEKEAHKLYKIADKHDLLLEKVIACKYLLGISERDHSTEGWANQQVYFENWTESTAQLAKFIEYTKKLHYLIHDSINKNRICSDELKGFLVDIPQLIEGPNISFASKFTLSYARRLGIFIEGGTLQDKLEKDIQIAELWLQHPNAIAAEPLNFIASYKQLLLGSLILHKQSIFDKYFKIFNYLSDKNKLKTNSSINIQFAFFRLKYNLQILSYSLKENFLAIWQLSKSYRKALPKYATHSNKTIYFVDLVNFLKMGLLSEQYEELIVLTLDLLYKWQVGKFKPRVYATIICAMLLSMYECKQKHLYNEIQKQKRKMEEHGTYDTVPKYIVSLLRKLMSKKRIGNGHLIYKHYHALIQDAFLQMTHVKKMNYDYLEVWLKMKIKATQPAGNVMG